jgi:hypothetical protein
MLDGTVLIVAVDMPFALQLVGDELALEPLSLNDCLTPPITLSTLPLLTDTEFKL